jgi:hypothetical protein
LAVEVLVHLVEGRLVVGVGVDRRHEALLDADRIVKHLGHGGEAVRGAGGVRDDHVVLRQLVVVDAVDDREVGAVGGSRDDDALGAGGQVSRGLLLRGEDAGAFHGDIDAELPVRQGRRVLDRRDPDLLAVDDEELAVDGDVRREAAMDGVEAEQVSVRLDRAEIVDRNHLDVRAAALHDAAKDVASDATESVDRDLHRHSLSSLV